VDGNDPTGGSRELARLIDRYGELLIPDLKHYYGIDLRELFLDPPPWTPRFLLSHINNLPYDSAFVAELRGGQQFRGWDENRYLLAANVNAIRVLSHIFILANMDPKKRKPDTPSPWPLPDKQEKKKRQDKPGSFAFIAKSLADKARRRKAKP
jgi:hypothetical protein